MQQGERKGSKNTNELKTFIDFKNLMLLKVVQGLKLKTENGGKKQCTEINTDIIGRRGFSRIFNEHITFLQRAGILGQLFSRRES